MIARGVSNVMVMAGAELVVSSWTGRRVAAGTACRETRQPP